MVKIPTKTGEKFAKKFVAINMLKATDAGRETVEVAVASSGEFVGGAVGIMAGTFAGIDETGVNDGADEGNAAGDGLFVLFLRMEGKFQFFGEIFFDYANITEELIAARHGGDDKKVVNIAPIMFIAEIEMDETIELVEKNIGK